MPLHEEPFVVICCVPACPESLSFILRPPHLPRFERAPVRPPHQYVVSAQIIRLLLERSSLTWLHRVLRLQLWALVEGRLAYLQHWHPAAFNDARVPGLALEVRRRRSSLCSGGYRRSLVLEAALFLSLSQAGLVLARFEPRPERADPRDDPPQMVVGGGYC